MDGDDQGRTRRAVCETALVCLSLALMGGRPAAARTPAVSSVGIEFSAPETSAARFHAEADEHYANQRFAQARTAWIQAYRRVEQGPKSVAYRTTLLSLITSATLEAYAVEGEIECVEETVVLLEAFLVAEPDLAPELHAVVADDLRRLRPVIDRATPRPTAERGTEPEDEASGEETTPVPPVEDAPSRRPTGVALISVGAVTSLGGIAAIIAGTTFAPRAQEQIGAVDDPVDREQAFLDREVTKGRGWIGGGAAVATIGIGLIVGGAVLLARHRAKADGRNARRRFLPRMQVRALVGGRS